MISTPGANANAVAELAVGLALSVARRISLLDRVLREGGLNGTPPQGFELSGRTVGVVGMGSVGRRTAMLFKNAFGAPLLAFDPFAPDRPSTKSAPSAIPASTPCWRRWMC